MNDRKGIILAGGKGTRLAPLTNAISKQLMPVYDKPMIYYPLTTLMMTGIKEIMIITTDNDNLSFQKLLGDGRSLGISLKYAVQENPEGIAQAFIIAKDFIRDSSVVLALGDNIFHGSNLVSSLKEANQNREINTLFAYPVKDPERYGIVEFDDKFNAIKIDEKPNKPKTNYAITGLYFYNNFALEHISKLKPSQRGELEITSLNQILLEEQKLKVKLLGRGTAWLDTGTYDSLHEAGAFIRTLEHRQGLKIGCPEEVAWRQRWISNQELEFLAQPLLKSGYGEYLLQLIDNTDINNRYLSSNLN